MESNEETSRVTPLSAAISRRRENSKIQTTEQQLRSIFEDVVQEHVSAKMTRLEQSINRMISQFEAINNGDADEAALRVTTDRDAVDLASIGIDIPTDEYYKYTCSDLQEKLSKTSYEVLKEIKKLNLRNDFKYHKSIRTGKVSNVQKCSEEAFTKLKIAFNLDQEKTP